MNDAAVAGTRAIPGPLPNLLATCRAALQAAEAFREAARHAVANLVAPAGKVDAEALEREQYAAHGFAWLATYVAALEALLGWAERLEAEGNSRELERLILQLGFAEYLRQMVGGIALSQVESSRPADLGLDESAVAAFSGDPAVAALTASGGAGARLRLAELLTAGHEADDFGALGLGDEMLTMIREQFRRFANDHMEAAHGWHLRDELIPLPVIEQLGELGVFGLTVSEDWGGAGLGKAAMCVVTEELARGYIGLGSLGTRSEIACELIGQSGTQDQKQRWLPGIASGALQVTAVFTEPNVGSDLGAIQTRAVRAKGADGSDTYKFTGNKTWITHGARSDLMTLMARTDPDQPGYKGLSMFIAEKPRGTDAEPFPATGMSGGEIGVLGYRGMKEYEIAFDGFEVPAAHLLGEVEGQGFKQLMATFESARIQTAARAVGVAQSALELGLDYALERRQFGKPLMAFPRVAGKLAWMAVETTIARQLTQAAARAKDSGRRCDIEAGMAKLLAARIAWSNADNALQIHGGNGYAQEFKISRVLCDARILNIFEGAAEIQAQVIARGLLSGRN
jgi:(2S)-methylsuccinyl-CoA dehydrogenase